MKMPICGREKTFKACPEKHKAYREKYKPYILKYVPCIFARFKCLVSQTLTKREKRAFSASRKTGVERLKTRMRHGERHGAETNWDFAFVKINLPAT